VPESPKVLTVYEVRVCSECGRQVERELYGGYRWGCPVHGNGITTQLVKAVPQAESVPLPVAEALATALASLSYKLEIGVAGADSGGNTGLAEMLRGWKVEIDAALHTYRQSVPEREDNG
jgi:hypothetical protein